MKKLIQTHLIKYTDFYAMIFIIFIITSIIISTHYLTVLTLKFIPTNTIPFAINSLFAIPYLILFPDVFGLVDPTVEGDPTVRVDLGLNIGSRDSCLTVRADLTVCR